MHERWGVGARILMVKSGKGGPGGGAAAAPWWKYTPQRKALFGQV